MKRPAKPPSAATIRKLMASASAGATDTATDAELLRRFAGEADQDAFAALARRHADLVFGVCRRALPTVQDAEDACQATFLLLARKAGTGRWQPSVANWLYTTARKVAANARVADRRRAARERSVRAGPVVEAADPTAGELMAAVDDELARMATRYREPLVLCYLEGLTRDEAAARLGVPAGTVKIRLERGRNQLHAALARRGLGLGTALVALAMSGTARALPARLHQSILAAAAGRVPDGVAALAGGTTMNGVMTKAAILVLAGAALVAGAGSMPTRAGGQADPAAAARPRASTPTAEARSDAIRLRGRVLGPDGKPVPGAGVYLAGARAATGDPKPQATAGPDGRFELAFRRTDLDGAGADGDVFQVLATARGYGFDTAAGEAGADLTLRLVPDVPVSGRVIDADGVPVAGATVRVTRVFLYAPGELDRSLAGFRKSGRDEVPPTAIWESAVPGQNPAATRADGKFRLTGIGRDRVAHLTIEGPGIEYARVRVVTRDAEPVTGPGPRNPQRIYGAAFDHLAAPSRPVRGLIRDRQTGKPVAGVRVESFGTTDRARTDAAGRFELRGHAKAAEYHLQVVPADGQPYFVTHVTVPDAPGLGPVQAELELTRGIPVRGRVRDRATGKPVRSAQVEYFAVFPSAYVRADGFEGSRGVTGPDGSFAVVALPGPGVIGVAGGGSDQYTRARVTVERMKEFFKTWTPGDQEGAFSERHLVAAVGPRSARGVPQENYNALVLVEPEEGAEPLTRDIALSPAATRKGTVLGPDGKPVAGVTAVGLSGHPFHQEKLGGPEFTVAGLDPDRPRDLFFLQPEKGLGARLEVRGADGRPLAVTLRPLGSASGRVLNPGGVPVAGLALDVNRAGLIGGAGSTQVTTDREGRFRVTGLVPGQKYTLSEANRPGPGGVHVREVVVESDKDTDLGDLTPR